MLADCYKACKLEAECSELYGNALTHAAILKRHSNEALLNTNETEGSPTSSYLSHKILIKRLTVHVRNTSHISS
jgi:hypothetical protein